MCFFYRKFSFFVPYFLTLLLFIFFCFFFLVFKLDKRCPPEKNLWSPNFGYCLWISREGFLRILCKSEGERIPRNRLRIQQLLYFYNFYRRLNTIWSNNTRPGSFKLRANRTDKPIFLIFWYYTFLCLCKVLSPYAN